MALTLLHRITRPNTWPFVVPSYRRGGPYSAEAVPTYADEPSRTGVKDRYDTPTEQHNEWPMGDRPPSNQPPGRWGKYHQDQLERSRRDENVINADEGNIAYQRNWVPVRNPYWWANQVNRPQRDPHEYSMLRNPDKNYLGRRDLRGLHYSAGQTVTDQQALALKGMQPQKHRSSTFRLEPIAFGEMTTSMSEPSGYAPQRATTASPRASSYVRSFRLS